MAITNKQDRQGARTVSEVERNVGKRFSAQETVLEENREGVGGVEEKVKAQNQRLDRLGEEITAQKSEIAELSTAITDLQTLTDTPEKTTIAQLVEKLAALTEEVATLKEKVEALEQKE